MDPQTQSPHDVCGPVLEGHSQLVFQTSTPDHRTDRKTCHAHQQACLLYSVCLATNLPCSQHWNARSASLLHSLSTAAATAVDLVLSGSAAHIREIQEGNNTRPTSSSCLYLPVWPESLVVHPGMTPLSCMKPIKQNSLVPASRPSPSPWFIDGGLVYTVKRLMAAHRWRFQYLVNWEDYGPKERSWVPASNIRDPEPMTELYRQHPEDCWGVGGGG